VGRFDVVRLVERVEPDLPVAAHDRGPVPSP
jgi:hypothetical protein